MTPRRRRPRQRLGRADPRRPSSPPTPLWPRRSARCSRTGCHRTRSALWSPARAPASPRRRSIGPAMTTAADGACPRGPGGCCRDAADGVTLTKPQGRHARKPSPLGVFRPICERPAAVEDRSEAGHWEGDLIIGKNNRSAAVTLTERVSRQTLVAALPHGYDARRTADAVTAALARQPRHLVRTLTWDQGREMARWGDIEDALGVKVYFCDPRSPWQRPTNRRGEQPQPGTAHHRHHPQPTLPPHPGLHRQKNQRGQNHTRSPALPQTLHRPPALPTPTANQRPAETLAAQRHRPQHRPGAPRHHRGPPQHHAPQAPRLALSPQRLC